MFGAEVEPVTQNRKSGWLRVSAGARSVDVLDEFGGCAIRAPELSPYGGVGGCEVEPVAKGGKAIRARGCAKFQIDVGDDGRAGAVRAPEFVAIHAVVGAKVQIVAKAAVTPERVRAIDPRPNRVDDRDRREGRCACGNCRNQQEGKGKGQ